MRGSPAAAEKRKGFVRSSTSGDASSRSSVWQRARSNMLRLTPGRKRRHAAAHVESHTAAVGARHESSAAAVSSNLQQCTTWPNLTEHCSNTSTSHTDEYNRFPAINGSPPGAIVFFRVEIFIENALRVCERVGVHSYIATKFILVHMC